MSAAMVKNPAETEAVMPSSAGTHPDAAHTALPLTTNMTASYLTSGGNSCLDEQIERLKRCEYLREGEVKALCLRAREILVDESNVQRVDAPVTVRVLLFWSAAAKQPMTFCTRFSYWHRFVICGLSGYHDAADAMDRSNGWRM